MARTKLAPVVKKEKQIILTKEQYDKLCDIRNTLDNNTDYINDLVENVDKEDTIQIGFTLGKIYNEITNAYGDIRTITWDISPDDDNEEEDDLF